MVRCAEGEEEEGKTALIDQRAVAAGKNRFCGLQMIQFECPRVNHPLVLFTFGMHSGESISQYAGNGKCCIWPVNKVEIHIAKTGFVDCK